MSLNLTSIMRESLAKAIAITIPMLWPLLAVTFIWLVYKLFILYRLRKAGMPEIDQMSGPQFEKRLAILFANLGYKVLETGKPSGDYGVDLVIEKNGIKTAVQAKCYKRHSVGEDSVREVYSGKNYYGCTEAIVVTNSNYSRMAWKLAKSNNVKLWNRNYLVKVLMTENKILL